MTNRWYDQSDLEEVKAKFKMIGKNSERRCNPTVKPCKNYSKLPMRQERKFYKTKTNIRQDLSVTFKMVKSRRNNRKSKGFTGHYWIGAFV